MEYFKKIYKVTMEIQLMEYYQKIYKVTMEKLYDGVLSEDI